MTIKPIAVYSVGGIHILREDMEMTPVYSIARNVPAEAARHWTLDELLVLKAMISKIEQDQICARPLPTNEPEPKGIEE